MMRHTSTCKRIFGMCTCWSYYMENHPYCTTRPNFILADVKTHTHNFKSFGKGLLGLKQEQILLEIIQVEYSVGLIFPLHELHSVL